MKDDWKYIVIYDRYNEIGWSGESEHYSRFKTYSEAIEFYDKLEVPEKAYDWSISWKKIYRIRQVKVLPSKEVIK